MASSRQKLKYAQSYALTLYLMEADNQKYLGDFLKYTKKALIGRGSSSTFRQMFKKRLEAIEKNHLKMK